MRAAIAAHEGQFRKGADPVPYVVHPVHVSIVLARWGMDDHVIQAGVLHDVVEDCDGWTVERVAREFGDEVAAIVADLSEDKSRTWEERKRHGIEHVAHMRYEAAVVKAADNLHNLQSLVASLREAEDRDAVWSRFRGGRDRTLAAAAELVDALERRLEERITRPLREALDELAELA